MQMSAAVRIVSHIRSPVRWVLDLAWLIRASRLIWGSIVHRINRIARIHRLTTHARTKVPASITVFIGGWRRTR